MRTLIFGGGGFIGINIAEAMLRARRDVVLFDRRIPAAALEELRSIGRVDAIEGDVRDPAAITSAFEGGVDAAVYGAAITADAARDASDPETILDVNLTSLVRVLRGARDAGVRRIVNLGSVAAFGAAAFPEDGSWLDETGKAEPQGMYAITKFAGERVAARLADLWRIDVRSVRLSAAFGPWERLTASRSTPSPQFQIAAHLLAGRTAILERAGVRDWVYAPDVAAAVLRLVEARSPRYGLHHVSTGQADSALEWGQALAAALPGRAAGCRLAHEGEAPNVSLHGSTDRASMATARATADLGFTAAWTGVRSAAHYAAWILAHPWCFEVPEGDGA